MIQSQIMAISDIALGYGSPQIPAFIQSLAQLYDTHAFVIETDEPHRPPQILEQYNRLTIKRSISALPYYTTGAHCERNEMAIQYANKHHPKILVFFTPMQLPIITRLNYKPEKVILYLLEIDRHHEQALQLYSQFVDHIIVPEYNRLKYILSHFCKRPYPKSHIMYNVSLTDRESKFIPSHKRNGRIIYAGTLNKELTLAHEFFEKPLSGSPIDIDGNFSGERADDLRKKASDQDNRKGVVYKSYIPSKTLHELLPHYAFSFSRWNPAAGLNYEFACPNKFFEALAYGVPPISAPHPQAVKIIEQYKCGILAHGFGAEHMKEAIDRAMMLYNTPGYADMVNNAESVYQNALNWDAQFGKFAKSLKD